MDTNDVYLLCGNKDHRSWYVLNTLSNMFSKHAEMNSVETPVGCGCVAVNSEIFVVGGGEFSKKVMVFDTNSRTWNTELPLMNFGRSMPVVVHAFRRLYVFGGLDTENNLNSSWAEYYDILEKEWRLLETPQELHDIHFSCPKSVIGGVVILLWNDDSFFLYNILHDKWKVFPVEHNIDAFESTGLSQMSTIASAPRNDHLIWYYGGELFAYDFSGRFTPSVNPFFTFSNDQPHPNFNTSTVLLATKQTSLLLLWNDSPFENHIFHWKTLRCKPDAYNFPVQASVESYGDFALDDGTVLCHSLSLQKQNAEVGNWDEDSLHFVDPWLLVKISRTMYYHNYLSYIRNMENGNEIILEKVGRNLSAEGSDVDTSFGRETQHEGEIPLHILSQVLGLEGDPVMELLINKDALAQLKVRDVLDLNISEGLKEEFSKLYPAGGSGSPKRVTHFESGGEDSPAYKKKKTSDEQGPPAS